MMGKLIFGGLRPGCRPSCDTVIHGEAVKPHIPFETFWQNLPECFQILEKAMVSSLFTYA
jgi:hypothetical protein